VVARVPISRQEFDDGRLDLSVPILQYLGARSDEAFTADEILYALLEIYERRATPAEVVVSLDDQVAKGVLESKQMIGMTLYTISIKAS
jgi:hypothetical protein